MSDEKCCFVDQRFEIVVNELRDAFIGGASGVTMFVYKNAPPHKF